MKYEIPYTAESYQQRIEGLNLLAARQGLVHEICRCRRTRETVAEAQSLSRSARPSTLIECSKACTENSFDCKRG
jgi:hypothetical protein